MDKVALEQFFLRVFLFPLLVSLHQCSILIFIYMLFLPKGKIRPGNFPKSSAVSEIGEQWLE
jgi:hypothetical protein